PLFTLTADDRVALAMPPPVRHNRIPIPGAGDFRSGRLSPRRLRRHFIALATGFAVAAGSTSAAGVAAAGTTPGTTTGATTAPTVVEIIAPKSVTSVHAPTATPTPPGPRPGGTGDHAAPIVAARPTP